MTTAVVDLTGFQPRVWLAPWRSMARVAARCGYPVTVAPGHGTGRVVQNLRRVARRAPLAVPADLRTRLAFGAGGHAPDADRLIWIVGSDFLLTSLVQCLRALPDRPRRHTIVLGEVWPSGVDRVVDALAPVLPSVDLLSVAIRTSVEPLRARGVPAQYLPMGFDPSVAPARAPDDRRIDVVNIGRRDPVQHAAILEAIDRIGGYYHYDTLATDTCHELEQHARFLGTMLGASWLSVTNPAKFNSLTDRAAHELETPGRLIEAASQGAVPVGWRNPAHDSDPYLADIPWISLGTDGTTWCDQLVELAEDRQAIVELATTCRGRALAGHTWAHRLVELLEATGAEVAPALRAEVSDWTAAAEHPWRPRQLERL